jgi:hypothetical protein
VRVRRREGDTRKENEDSSRETGATEKSESRNRIGSCGAERGRACEWHMQVGKLSGSRIRSADGHVYNLPLFVIYHHSAALVLSDVTLLTFAFLSDSFYAASLNFNKQKMCQIRVMAKEKYHIHKDSLFPGSFQHILFHFQMSLNLFQVQDPPMLCSD